MRGRGVLGGEAAEAADMAASVRAPVEAIHHCTCRWGRPGVGVGEGSEPRRSGCSRFQSKRRREAAAAGSGRGLRSSYLEVVVRVPRFVLPGVGG